MTIKLKLNNWPLSFGRICADIEVAKKIFDFVHFLASLKAKIGRKLGEKVPIFDDLEGGLNINFFDILKQFWVYYCPYNKIKTVNFVDISKIWSNFDDKVDAFDLNFSILRGFYFFVSEWPKLSETLINGLLDLKNPQLDTWNVKIGPKMPVTIFLN